MKFTQPVSMQCSQEQFERDLKEPLDKLGYELTEIYDFNVFPILSTNNTLDNSFVAIIKAAIQY